MPAKPLTANQLADARRLTAAFERVRDEIGLTQEKLAELCGWKTQGSVSQYMRGKIPLNITALHKFADAFNIAPQEISPDLVAKAQGITKRYRSTRAASAGSDDAARVTESGDLVSAAEISKLILLYQRCRSDAREAILELAGTGAEMSIDPGARAAK